MRKMTSKEFWNLLTEFSHYKVPTENVRLELIDLIVDKENLFPAKPDYIVACMGQEKEDRNDEGGTYGVLSEFSVFDVDGVEIDSETFEEADRFMQIEDIVGDLVRGSNDDEIVIPLEKDFIPLELYIDD